VIKNALALQDALEKAGVYARVMSAIEMMNQVPSLSSAAAGHSPPRERTGCLSSPPHGQPVISQPIPPHRFRAMEINPTPFLRGHTRSTVSTTPIPFW